MMDDRGAFLVYIAGPYRADSEYGVRKNIERSAARAAQVWRLNIKGGMPKPCEFPIRVMPVSPVLNTAFFGGLVPDRIFLNRDLELLRRCDALLTISGIFNSRGVLAETDYCRAHGIPVCHTLVDLVVALGALAECAFADGEWYRRPPDSTAAIVASIIDPSS